MLQHKRVGARRSRVTASLEQSRFVGDTLTTSALGRLLVPGASATLLLRNC